jgi:hypothetical protein
VEAIQGVVRRADEIQRGKRVVAFPLAVLNAVRRLWLPALDPDRLREADVRALRDHASVEERGRRKGGG